MELILFNLGAGVGWSLFQKRKKKKNNNYEQGNRLKASKKTGQGGVGGLGGFRAEASVP